MESEFLNKEYELSYQQLRFYDEKHSSLIKFLATLATAVTTAQFGILKFIGEPNDIFYVFQMLLSIIVFVLSNTIYLSLLQNRLYFVFVARQLNAIRKHFLESPSSGFKKNNQLYTSTNFSAFKLNSLHSLQMFGVSFISSLFYGYICILIFRIYKTNISISICVSFHCYLNITNRLWV